MVGEHISLGEHRSLSTGTALRALHSAIENALLHFIKIHGPRTENLAGDSCAQNDNLKGNDCPAL